MIYSSISSCVARLACRLQVRPQWVIHQYGLKFEPPIAGRGLRIKLIDEQAPFKQQSHVTDGVILYMLQPISDLAGDPPSRARSLPHRLTLRSALFLNCLCYCNMAMRFIHACRLV